MIIAYFILSVLTASGILLVKRSRAARALASVFYAGQAALCIWLVAENIERTQLAFFTADTTAVFFFGLLSVISPIVFLYSVWYLDSETVQEKNRYHALCILLCASMTGVYLSNNIAVTWIFLEATTLCTAGLIYHRKTPRSLEATWKYIFVCSVGITMAYLGILLLGGMSQHGELSYQGLSHVLGEGNELFLKLAFLFVITGYSCKMEVFPLYTIGVDGNLAAPAPVSALISTCLVNAGFVALFRIYKVMETTAVAGWVSNVMIVSGLLSIGVGALLMRRTNHYKRFLSYSTVENMGIVMLGLGIGGVGVFAALVHVGGHSLVKSAMFLQMARVGKTYGHYRMNRTGDYMKADRMGAMVLILATVMLLAFPPSPLFISEIMIFTQMIASGNWILLIVTVLMLCVVMYNFATGILMLCYKPARRHVPTQKINPVLLVPVIALLGTGLFFGIWQPEWLLSLIESILN